MRLAFVAPPEVDFDVRALDMLDVSELPFIHEKLRGWPPPATTPLPTTTLPTTLPTTASPRLLLERLERVLVMPHSVHIPLEEWLGFRAAEGARCHEERCAHPLAPSPPPSVAARPQSRRELPRSPGTRR